MRAFCHSHSFHLIGPPVSSPFFTVSSNYTQNLKWRQKTLFKNSYQCASSLVFPRFVRWRHQLSTKNKTEQQHLLMNDEDFNHSNAPTTLPPLMYEPDPMICRKWIELLPNKRELVSQEKSLIILVVVFTHLRQPKRQLRKNQPNWCYTKYNDALPSSALPSLYLQRRIVLSQNSMS
jgi:hypothetical protein